MDSGVSRVPWRIVGYVVAAVLALVVINHGLGFVPGTPQWFGKRAAARADRLEGQVSTLEREATGNAEIRTATETFHTREVIVREATAQAITEARAAPDANTPLSDERANRLRRADGLLCLDAPALCPPADPAGSRAPAVQSPGPAG
jgi:hypothetical protein